MIKNNLLDSIKVRARNIFFYAQKNQWVVFCFLFLVSVLISIHNISLGVYHFWGGDYTFFNNFLIFKNSFSHLLENTNLYQPYPNEYADLYKYSPTFAFIMVLFNYLPSNLGLVLWNCLNIFVLCGALYLIKSIDPSKKIFLLVYILLELILSVQNSQSNCILAGLTIISFNLLEKGKNNQATFFIALGSFIKIYSIVGCLLLLLYPNKIKSLIYFAMWFIIFLLLPLVVIDVDSLIWQYKNWLVLLSKDEKESIGMSLYVFTQYFLPVNFFKLITFLIGTLFLFTPLLKFKLYSNSLFRLNYLALLMIWLVVFNYKAESPTYAIAMTGVAIWFFTSKKSKMNFVLLLLTLMFTSIWCTDIIPSSVRDNWSNINQVKSFFPILVFFKLYFDLISQKVENIEIHTSQ